MSHITVMLNEAVESLAIKENSIIVDFTLGGGGHSLKILNLVQNITLISFDVDLTNIKNFTQYLEGLGYRSTAFAKGLKLTKDLKTVYLINDNFENIELNIDSIGLNKIDGALADLGWSTDQLKTVPGLSYERPDEDLDMRLDTAKVLKASDFLNVLGRKQLRKMFEDYADIKPRLAKVLAEKLVKDRQFHAILKVSDLLDIIDDLYSKNPGLVQNEGSKNSFLAKIFQALRISVNIEFAALEKMIKDTIGVLNKGGYLSVITFHSGEEKVFKASIQKDLDSQNVDLLYEGLRPTVDELKNNISARSAKLWTIKKVK